MDQPQRELWCTAVSAIRVNNDTHQSTFRSGYVLAESADEAREKSHAVLREHFPTGSGWTNPVVIVGHIPTQDLMQDARILAFKETFLYLKEEANMQAAYAQDLKSQLESATADLARAYDERKVMELQHAEQIQRLNNLHAETIISTSRTQDQLSQEIERLNHAVLEQVETVRRAHDDRQQAEATAQAVTEQLAAREQTIASRDAMIERLRGAIQGTWIPEVSAQRDRIKALQDERDQQAATVRALQSVLSLSNPCIHVQIEQARAAQATGNTISLEELDARLTREPIQWATGKMPHPSD